MPGPIENVAVKSIQPATQTDAAQKTTGDSAKFEQIRQSGAEAPGATGASEFPPLKEVTPAEHKQIERDLRRRLEKTNSTDPSSLYARDIRDLRKGLDQVRAKVESTPKAKAPAGATDRLAEVEAQYKAFDEKLKKMPDTNNLKDLLAMQTEMFKMSQNIELLTKVVDSALSGLKSTMQMQI